jgi:multiple sugar transport system substrate-binding protein
LALLLAATTLSACGSSGGSGGDTATTAAGGETTAPDSGGSGSEITLSVMDYYDNDFDHEMTQKALDTCATQVGVKITRESVPGGELVAKILQLASSKTLPDVLMIDNPDMASIAEIGALTPLKNFGIEAEDFAEGIVAAGSLNGELYGLAPTVNTIALMVNTDMLKEAGVEAPKTWDELKTVAKKLTKGDTYGIAVSAIANYEGVWQFLPFFWTNGGNEDNFNTPQAAEALQLWLDLVNDGSLSTSALNWSQADANDQFMAGKAAMQINGPWQLPVIAETAPDLNYEVVLIPTKNAGETSISPLGGEVWTAPVTDRPENQAKAGEFLKCLFSSDVQLQLGIDRSCIPGRTSLKAAFLEARPEMGQFVEQVENGRARTGILGSAWPKTADAMVQALQLALSGEATPMDALNTAAADLGT